MHSLTKFMGGHGTTMGGIIVDQRQIPVGASTRRGSRCSPSRMHRTTIWSTRDHFGDAAYIGRCRSVYQRTLGSVLSPLNAFLLLQGIEIRGRCGWSGTSRMRARSPSSCATIRESNG